MKVTIVIPNWNGADLLAKALNSLHTQTYQADIIVVDNGSVDESVSLIEKNYPKVVLIKLPNNKGFAGGVNTGIRHAMDDGYDAVALFNNDAVADKDWLKNLVDTMQNDKNIGIVHGKQLRSDKTYIDSSGDMYSIWGMPFPRGRNQKDAGQYDTPEEMFSAPAGATLYRTALFEDIDLFDERFFAYYEDVDISFRARLAGWKAYYQPEAEVYHHVSATGDKLGSFTRYHATKNFFILYLKDMPAVLFWKYLPLFLLQSARLLASSVLRGGGLAYLKGLGRFLLYLPSVLASRWQIQEKRKVSAKQIDAWLYHARPPKIPVL